ncbi:MAG: bacillithiol biosynthesis cysteine-adding enzyme BshC [Vicinamibacterales bacterium]
MPSHPDTVASGIVRDVIEFGRLPWIRPLVQAHANNFASVASLFAGNPADPVAWRTTIARVQAAALRRPVPMAALIAAQQSRRGAPAEATRAAALLENPQTVAILTGQQAGLFGGPFYTLLKAITTVLLARQVTADHGVPTVPVFWVDAEDHDWDEVRTAHVLDRDFALASVALDPLPGAGSRPVGGLCLDELVGQSITALEQLLSPTEFTPGLLAGLRRRYQPGETMSGAFAGWMEDLLGRHGLVVFESSDPAAKPFVAGLFDAELSDPGRTSRLARRAGHVMAELGHTPQIEPADESVCLFYVNADSRRPVRYRDGQYSIGDEVRTVDDLRREVAEHPDRFSPNVLLRPLVQDQLFPTVAYVAGPSELAYHAQLGTSYRALGVEPPLLCSRASATLLDSAALRFLGRQELPLEALEPQDESALNQILERQLPPSLDEFFQQMTGLMSEQAIGLKQTVSSIDPTLVGAIDTTVDKVRDTLKSLQGKIIQASKKKDDTLRRQFVRTRALAFPGGHPQERLLNVAFFMNRYGPALIDHLLDALPALPQKHYVLAP